MSSSVGADAVETAETALVEFFLAAFRAGAFFTAFAAGRRAFGVVVTAASETAFSAACTSLLVALVFRGTVFVIVRTGLASLGPRASSFSRHCRLTETH